MRERGQGLQARVLLIALSMIGVLPTMAHAQVQSQPVRPASQRTTVRATVAQDETTHASRPEALPPMQHATTPGCEHFYPGGGAPNECPHCLANVQARCGVYCPSGRCSNRTWDDVRMIPWQVFGHGEYIGPARIPAVPQYRLRVDDQLEFVFRITEEPTDQPYRLVVGDTLKVDSLTTAEISREVTVQPDGNISLLHLGQVKAAGRTLSALVDDLNSGYEKFIRKPEISVIPTKLNTRLLEFRNTVDTRYGVGGQTRQAKITPEGTIQLPAIGSVPAQGLTMYELKWEVEQRYLTVIPGIEVTPVLLQRAARFVYVVGEVKAPGRYELTGPTSVMQGISLAGGWNNGGNLREIIVFRRDECWQLMATRLNVRPALYGKDPCPADDIWLRDSDILLVPKTKLLCTDDAINLLFTRGLYSVVPMTTNFAFFTDLSGTGGAVVVGP